jgi:DNA-binding NarL/FixJ family response regulator
MCGYHLYMVLAVLDDLLFTSKIRAVATATGQSVMFVRRRDGVMAAIREHSPSLVIFDLDRAPLDAVGLIQDIRADRDVAATRLVAFASHVHTDRIAEAQRAGCNAVLARSTFVTSLPAILAGEPLAAPRDGR